MDNLAQVESSASALATAVQSFARCVRGGDAHAIGTMTVSQQSTMEIEQARSNILSMISKLQTLVSGPTDFLEHLTSQTEMLACLQWLGKSQILACIPRADAVPIKDVADLAHVTESQLTRVVRLTATAGFLREGPHGFVGRKIGDALNALKRRLDSGSCTHADTALSGAFVDNPSLLDAAMFVAESSAPAALKMQAPSVDDANSHYQTAYNLAVGSTKPFRVACQETPRLSRQYGAYLHFAAGLHATDVLSDMTLAQLNWSKLRSPRVVEMGVRSTIATTTAQKLAHTYPSLQFVVQIPDTPTSIMTDAVNSETSPSSSNIKIMPRALGTKQTVTDAGVYILHISSFSPYTIHAELQAHCSILRANNGVMFIPTAHLLPEPGNDWNLVGEAVARARDLSFLQLANEKEVELRELLDVIEMIKDSSGRLVVAKRLFSNNNAVTALILKYQVTCQQ